jgi:hypothetical protein
MGTRFLPEACLTRRLQHFRPPRQAAASKSTTFCIAASARRPKSLSTTLSVIGARDVIVSGHVFCASGLGTSHAKEVWSGSGCGRFGGRVRRISEAVAESGARAPGVSYRRTRRTLDDAVDYGCTGAGNVSRGQLNAAWKNICGLRNVEHAEKRRVSETEAQKHSIDEKCADVRRDSHMQ